MSPWSQALLVCFCFSAGGRQGKGKGLRASAGAWRAQAAKRAAAGARGSTGHQRHPQSWTLVTLARAAHAGRAASCPGRWGHGAAAGQGPRRGPDPPLTLVLQGLEPLAGLVVQLLQVRGPRAGEEDVVGAFLARLVLHAQPLVVLSLGGACEGRERGQRAPRMDPCRTAAPRPVVKQDAAPEPPPGLPGRSMRWSQAVSAAGAAAFPPHQRHRAGARRCLPSTFLLSSTFLTAGRGLQAARQRRGSEGGEIKAAKLSLPEARIISKPRKAPREQGPSPTPRAGTGQGNRGAAPRGPRG